MFDDFIVGPQSEELIAERLEYEAQADWERYCASLSEIEEDGFITPVEYLD